MRVNVYTEELLSDPTPTAPVIAEVVHADYVSSRTVQPMRNYGLRIYLASSKELHYVPPRDDDRSAVTFWCGSSEKKVFAFLEMIRVCANISTLHHWHERTRQQQTAAEQAEAARKQEG